MPRFSFKKDSQKTKEQTIKTMNKSKPAPFSTSSPESPIRESSRRSDPAPYASSNIEALVNVDEKTPASILRSGRYKIQVQRTQKGDDGFADDSPYWEAAKLASTQNYSQEDSESSSSDKRKKVDNKELKRKEKQRKKRAEIEKLKNQYKEGQAKVKTNLHIGTGSQSESSDHNESDSDNGDWLKKSLQRNGKGKRKVSGAAMFSPSDLSRASTIPPTPATPRAIGTPSSTNEHQSIDEEAVADIEFQISHNDDDSNEEEEHATAPLSPIHEEHVAKEARARKDEERDKLENKVLDILDESALSPDADGSAKIDFAQNDDYSDGSVDDGPGFELADNQPSPQAEMDESSSSHMEVDTSSDMEVDMKQPKGRKGERKKSIDSEESADNESNSESRSKLSKKKSKRKKSVDSVELGSKKIPPKKKSHGRPKKVRISAPFGGSGYQSGPREYRTIPVEEFEDDDDDAPEGTRRSTRRKFRPLLFWKNEKIVYEPNHEDGDLAEVFGDMPMVAGVQQAQPTPYKKRTVTPKYDSDNDNESGRKATKKSTKVSSEVKLFDSDKLRKKFDIDDGDTAPIWWDSKGATLDKKVIFYSESMTLHDLPLIKKRSKKEGKVVAKAAQAFNVDPPGDGMPGFICGCMEVPPRGIKDEEGVGPCFQVFNVGACQPKSVELAIADPDVNGGNYDAGSAKRFLLSMGDMFQIPAGNVYRIQNHSKTFSCTLNWTIIRPAPMEDEE